MSNKWLNSNLKITLANETTQETDLQLSVMLKGLQNNYLTTKVVVNPEISQKIQAAESVALAKYMEYVSFHIFERISSICLSHY